MTTAKKTAAPKAADKPKEATPEAPKDANEAPKETNENDAPEAPEAVEPKAVEVSPADQSDVKTDNIHGKDYTVTAEQGYRVKQ